MKKNQKIYGIIFQHRRFAEKNSICTLFNPEHGIEQAVAYGVYSVGSKLSETNSIFSSGYFYLYQSRERGLKKISEYTSVKHRERIVHNLTKFLHASIWSELIMASDSCGGEYQRCFALFEHALTALEHYHDDCIIQLISIRFMWRCMLIMGVYRDISKCYYCKKMLIQYGQLYILRGNCELICPLCCNQQHRNDNLTIMSHAHWNYLTTGMNQSFAQSIADNVLYERLDILWEYMVQTITHTIGRQLKSIYVLQKS